AWPMTRQSLRVFVCGVLVSGLLLAACNFSPAPGQPTAAVTPSLTATATPERVASATLTAAPPGEPASAGGDLAIVAQAITPANTPTPITPSATPTITDTPGPFEHVVSEADISGLIGIVFQYGHYSLDVLDDVVAMNPNIPSADRLPPPGSVILIPRPTATATPQGGELTATLLAQYPVSPMPERPTGTHVVVEGQTMVGIVGQYDTTMRIMADLNPGIGWLGCDFSIPSGGPNCGPPLSIGQELTVPLPTATPTLSPTPSGAETATLTPTLAPVRLLWPPSGVSIMGGPLVLRWVSAGALGPQDFYQVTVTDDTAGLVYTEFARGNTLTLPSDLQPGDDVAHAMTWSVTVVRVGDDNVAVVIGSASEGRPFTWTAP
ncbi:MAG: LysM peptidoglycan-binding domain-containing protein, partial [Anaerolineae bacterium]|nr:LysM peptidoglycan-binding domain-containing protein [Anaerolineae bacterium]